MCAEKMFGPDYDRLVIDGGMGTEIHKQLKGQFNSYERQRLWSASVFFSEHEPVVGKIHKSFLEAGADILTAFSYKLFLRNLKEELNMNESDATALIKKTITTALQERDAFWNTYNRGTSGRIKPIVAAGLGPFGTQWSEGEIYSGSYVDKFTIEEMHDVHAHKSRAVLAAGAELLAFETVPAVKEARAIVRVMQGLPTAAAWLVFSCKDGQHLCNGDKFSEAVSTTLDVDNIVGVGVNCSRPQYVTSLLQQIPTEVKAKKRIVVYPNTGEVWNPTGFWHGSPDAKPLHEYVQEWIQNGANWIGGCCNIGPEDIVKIRNAMFNI